MLRDFPKFRLLIKRFFQPGIAFAGLFSYSSKALVSVLVFNVALGAVAYFYMELQSAQIARLERAQQGLADAQPKFKFFSRLVEGRFYDVLSGPRDNGGTSDPIFIAKEFGILFPDDSSYPKQRFDIAVRQLSVQDTSVRATSLFAGYTGLLRIVLSLLEDDLRSAGILGDPVYGATGDVITRHFPLLIDNAAKQILAPKLPARELAAYASGAQLFVDDSSDRIRTALRNFAATNPSGNDILARFEKLAESIDRSSSISTLPVNFDDENDPSIVSMRTIAAMSELWASLAYGLEERIAASLKAERERGAIVVATLLAVMLVLAYIAVATSMAIRASITQLSKGSNDFCAGNLESRVTVTSRDEFALLAMNFNQVADQCSGLLEELRQRSAQEQQNLEFIVAERTQELESANHNLRETLLSLKYMQAELIQSEKMAALGGLVAGVAHEVNTPLGLAYTMVTHLDDQIRNLELRYMNGILTASDLESFLKIALESAAYASRNLERATSLIQSFKQVAVDRSSDVERVFEVSAYLGEIVRSLNALLRKGAHLVTVDVREPISLNSCPGAFGQVITNLIVNAVVHGFENKLQGEIVIRAEKSGKGGCLLTVTDNGRGMSSDVVSRVFEPFFTTKRGNGGSGLGLSIVYNLVTQQLGGAIRCESVEGQMTRFTLTMPSKE